MNPGEVGEWELADGTFVPVKVLMPLGSDPLGFGVAMVLLRLDNGTRTVVHRSGRIVEGLPA